MERTRIEAVALDLWYTTWYHRPEERSDYHRAKRRAWVSSLVEAGASPARGRVALDRLRGSLNFLEAKARVATLEEQARWVGRELGVHVDANRLIRRLNGTLARTRLHPTPGVKSFLRKVRDAGLPVGMVSNICDESPEGLRARLRTEGLLHYFDHIVLSSEFGKGKPDPAPFLACFQALGVRASRALFVGDLPVDAQGARAVHSQFVLYLGVDRESPRSYRLKRLSEPISTPRARSWNEVREQCLGPASGR